MRLNYLRNHDSRFCKKVEIDRHIEKNVETAFYPRILTFATLGIILRGNDCRRPWLGLPYQFFALRQRYCKAIFYTNIAHNVGFGVRFLSTIK